MKKLVWLKHNNIMLINLCVIGLMLWLTISFLVRAVSERDHALQLQSSVDAQQAIYAAGAALSIDELTNTADFSDPSNEKSKRLSQQVNTSLEANDAMFSITRYLIDQPEFSLHSRISHESLVTLADRLETRLANFVSQRDTLVEELKLGGSGNVEANADSLLNLQGDILLNMIALADGITFLPDNKASDVSVMQSMFVEAMKARLNISQYQMSLSTGAYTDSIEHGRSGLSPIQPRAVIQNHVNNIGSLSSSLDSSLGLVGKYQDLQSSYQSQSLQAFESNAGQGEKSLQALTDLKTRIDDLAKSGLQEISANANAQLKRANRNMAIDVGLILLCLLIAVTTILLNRRLKFLAYSDHLTGLANRVSLEQWLKESIGPLTKKNQKHSLIYIDLDRFKSVNDNYGHDFGDELITLVGQRLVSLCDKNAVVSRLGGDEFGIFLRDIKSDENVMQLADNLVEAVTEEIVLREHVVRVGASAGVSFYPEDCDSGLALLKNADIAMYHNKATSQNGAYRYDAEVAVYYQRRLQVEIDLKKALENDEFELHYQPKVGVVSGEVESVEALLRWKQGDQGYVSPAEFVPIAEELSLMGDIGKWVLDTACEEMAALHKLEGLDFNLAINISAQQFRDERFEDQIHNALENSGLRNLQLELEVTESLLMQDQDRVISTLRSLRSVGVKIAIDDFGTGFSSLQYLQKLPLDTLKIDRAFVLALDDANPEESVANSIVQLAALFKLETVAEGVETEEQDRKIRSLGVNHIQGFRYSKPVPGAELGEVIRSIPGMFGSDSETGYIKAA